MSQILATAPAPHTRQQGLTLIELLVVVSIVSAAAYMSLALLDDAGQQGRFDSTKLKYQQIKYVIAGASYSTNHGNNIGP
ncbi:MAG: type II secretion system GspH family protein, partial [Cellvibrionaceae bacterium]|nr:type II secretion system GspH family protein [Cellvibrionaceae bacterium]